VDGISITQHWLIPEHKKPKIFSPHPTLSAERIRERTQYVWDQFYSWRHLWERSAVVKSLRSRVAFMLISKLSPECATPASRRTAPACNGPRAGRATSASVRKMMLASPWRARDADVRRNRRPRALARDLQS
jgi:hypothetical protein